MVIFLLMHLFQIKKKNLISTNTIKITGKDFQHIKKSLRKRKGDSFYTTDGSCIYECSIQKRERTFLFARIKSRKKVIISNKTKISLFIGMIQFSKFETILNSAVQLGVIDIYPLNTEFTQKRSITINKFKRWEKIIMEAGKQSFNPHPPVLKNIKAFAPALKLPGLNILLHPYAEKTLKEILPDKKPDRINIFIGPEGGFSENEIKLAIKNKAFVVKLPYNILRSEMAVVSTISNVIFFYS